MSVKFTTIESKDKHQLELLFEFLDYELPEYIDFEYVTKLGKTVFVNNLQTNQIKGIYLQPIKLEAEFVGTYYSSKEKSADKKIITAKQRADQLGRLQGQLLKFFFDGFKQIVIIENFKMRVHNQEHVEVDMTLQPHDIMNAVSPSNTVKLEATTIELLSDDLDKVTKDKIDKNPPDSNFDEILTEFSKEQKKANIENKRAQANNLNNHIQQFVKKRLNLPHTQQELKEFTKLSKKSREAKDIYLKRLDNYEKDAVDNMSIDLQNIANDINKVENVEINVESENKTKSFPIGIYKP